MVSLTGCRTRPTKSSKSCLFLGLRVHKISFLTLPSTWGIDNPDLGSREVLTDPWNAEASEFTWTGDGGNKYNTTRGNNGIAQINPSGGNDYLDNHRPTSADDSFQYEYDPSMSDPSSYVDASITQLFYTANKCHDLFYLLGFNEAAGNFEIDNNGQGGQGEDFVVLNAQDGSGTNNANFATPPDGQTPRMRMYIWDMTTPKRDASFDAGVVIHEYTHGGEFSHPLPLSLISLSPPNCPTVGHCLPSFQTAETKPEGNKSPHVSPAAPPTPTASRPSKPAAWARAGATSWA